MITTPLATSQTTRPDRPSISAVRPASTAHLTPPPPQLCHTAASSRHGGTRRASVSTHSSVQNKIKKTDESKRAEKKEQIRSHCFHPHRSASTLPLVLHRADSLPRRPPSLPPRPGSRKRPIVSLVDLHGGPVGWLRSVGSLPPSSPFPFIPRARHRAALTYRVLGGPGIGWLRRPGPGRSVGGR
jgi:hypothetical protein